MFTFSFLNTGVQKYDMFLVNYSIPLRESTFACRIFDLPVKTDYHVIASKPINYQHKLLGQVAVYGCSKWLDLFHLFVWNSFHGCILPRFNSYFVCRPKLWRDNKEVGI